MRLLLLLSAVVCLSLVHSAPVGNETEVVVEPTTTQPESQDEVVGVTEVEEATTVYPTSDREGKQLDEDEDENDDEEGDEEEDDDEDEEEEKEEEERRIPTKTLKSKAKKPGVTKPVPVLGEGVEDDEAEDLGIFDREEPKSDEKGSDEKSSEDKDDEEDDDDDAESEEERDDPVGPNGLVAEPGSSERNDVEETPAAPEKSTPEIGLAEQPLAVAVVQPEESNDPVVPVIVEEKVGEVGAPKKVGDKSEVGGKKKQAAVQQDDDDDDDDDDEEDEDDDDDSGRSEHVNRARSAYNPSPVLYYYPFPEAPAAV